MKTALHTVSYAGVWPGQARLTLSETITHAAKLGFDGLMIMAKRPHLSVLDFDNAAVLAIKNELDQAGLAVACLAAYNNFSADAAHPDIPINEMQLAYLTRCAEITSLLGGEIVRVFTAYQDASLTDLALRDRVVTNLKEAARRAADHGCTLAVQNHHDCGAHWEMLLDLITDVAEPNCRAGFDAWAPTLHGDDIVAAARAMAPHTIQTIVADYVYRKRFSYLPQLVNYQEQPPLVQAVPMGEGMIDYPGFLSTLQCGGFDGYVIYEMCSPLRGGGTLENLDHYAQAFLNFMKTLG
ncbi:MAG: sugar phosphate isomerase/epimerase family protein [Armatimonadia bacterium]